MPAVTIGSDRFVDAVVPLILDDRFFLLQEQDGKDIWTIFTFQGGEPVIEILYNEPKDNPQSTVRTNPTGIMTVSDPQSGKFLYRIRPGSKRSTIFAVIGSQETEIEVLDRKVRIGTNVFKHNIIAGLPVGIEVCRGRIVIGASLPAEFRRLLELTP
jgi:hypothetical protein